MDRAWLALAMAYLLAACGQQNQPVGYDRQGSDEVAHGERLTAVLGCQECHGKDLTGRDWSSEGFATMSTANVTLALAGYTDKQLEQVIRSGQRPGGRELWEMPSHLFTRLTGPDMKALIAYLRTVPIAGKAHPDPIFFEQAKQEIAAGTYKSSAQDAAEMGQREAPDAGPGHEQARYIVRTACAECHGVELRGGVPFPGAPFRPDLRIVAAYDNVDFFRLLTTGKAAGDRELHMMSPTARSRYSHLTPPEREAIHAYLVALAVKDP